MSGCGNKLAHDIVAYLAHSKLVFRERNNTSFVSAFTKSSNILFPSQLPIYSVEYGV